MILLLVACVTPIEPPAEATPAAQAATAKRCAELPTVSWDAWGAGFFRTYCTACHSSANTTQRSGAPVGIDFDTEAAVHAHAADVRRVVLEAGTMPVGGGVYRDDLVLLEVYLACGTAP
ncbi:MAG: hypothetical protein Q8P41_00340 [Pseudomonadota bacterium]|nr:hypothetical protein [Pseudomonadota bacterium]